MKVLDPSRGILFGAAGALVLTAGLALAACTPAGNVLTFVGPQVEGVRDFHQVDLTDGSRTRLMPGVGGLGVTLRWLPDGAQAVVYRELDRNYYLADLAGGALVSCLTCASEGLTGPELSPDGALLAWGAPDGIYLQDLQDFGVAKLADVERPGWLTWAPDGRQLAFAARVGTLQVFQLDVDGGEILQLTHAAGEQNVESFAPAWSPRGNRIAFHSLDQTGLHLMSVEADGGEPRLLADWESSDEIYDPGLQAPPVWSPDGNSLLFAAASSAGDLDIFSVAANGEGLRNLTGAAGDDWDPAWSPDGELIAFVTDRDGDQEIYLMNPDGGEPRNISQLPTTPESNPAWRP